jgi:hypothetical protein
MKRCFFFLASLMFIHFFYEKYIRMISGGSVGVGGLLIIVHPSGQRATASLHDTGAPLFFFPLKARQLLFVGESLWFCF